MAAKCEEEEMLEAKAEALRHVLIQSATAFPQSFPVIDRNFSNASSVFTDTLDSQSNLASEQQDALNSIEEAENRATEPDHQQEADAASKSDPAPQEQLAPLQEKLDAKTPNGVIKTPAEDRQEEPHATTIPEEGKSKGSFEKSGAQPGVKLALVDKVAESDSAGSPHSVLQLSDSPPHANGDADSKASGSSLSADSEPFVPSADSSEQVTPRGQEVQLQSASASARLNVNAAAFVPSSGSQTSTVGDESAPTTWQSPLQLQFGSLPQSLSVSPQLCADGQQEHPGFEQGKEHGNGEGGTYPEGEQWQGWNEGYDYEGYEGATYVDGDGCQYYQQADGTWVSYWDGQEAGSRGGGYDEGNGVDGYDAFDGYYDNGYATGRYRNRVGRNSKRVQDRKRGPASWQGAVLDVLESQFPYSRVCLHEMLELHEGNLEVALDMLAQLEAEMDGQLPASGQYAPELNEENFPSLSSAQTASPQPKISRRGFADAIKSLAGPNTKSCTSKPEEAPKGSEGARAAGGAQGSPIEWKDTGAAVGEAYTNARSVARDHARLRNTFFQEATKAFLAGNKALAKELGGKGREQSELMKAAHAEASQAIYKHRNPTSGRKGKGSALIDLHGLHVKEAISILEDEIATARRSRPKGGRGTPHRLSVLVGIGRHTKGSKTPARLPAAVEEWLQASQISFSCTAPGLLELKL